MEMLELFRAGEFLARYPLGARALEIGRASNCDVAVEDPDLAERHFLLLRRRGAVVVYDVSAGRRQRLVEYALPLGRSVPLGRNHELRCVPGRSGPADGDVATRPMQAMQTIENDGTDVLSYPTPLASKLQVVVGRSGDLRRVLLADLPVHFGRCADNDIRLSDNAVSERHLRLEPCEAGLLARDLDSRNGTFVNGVRMHTALVTEGTVIRIGRTELRVVAREDEPESAPQMVAESSSMLEVLCEVRRVAGLPWPVLIAGESGTGKEGIALALHQHSARSRQPFVAVNAGGLTRELVESQLFGHERGAFTGAANRHRGVFEQAQGGTLFLDEVGELPLELQTRLLRVLETGDIRRVGGETAVRVDVRLVCATHRDLRQMVAEGSFRQDLFYRIARVVIPVPPLRARPEDLRALARRFLSEISRDLGPRTLTERALQHLLSHTWPGNVRELRNVLSAAAAASSGCIDLADIELALERVGSGAARVVTTEMILRVLAECSGNRAATARTLGMARSTLRDRLRAIEPRP